MRPPNPYIAGPPVRADAPSFVRRQDVLDFVDDVLAAPGQNLAVLTGQRRIGKTSALQLLERRPPFGCVAVFFDLQTYRSRPLAATLLALARTIADRFQIEGPTEDELGPDGSGFARKFLPRALKAAGESRLVVLFDELDALRDESPRPEATATLWADWLYETLGTQPALAAVLAAGRRVEDFPARFKPLFKNAQHKHLSFLTRHEAITLIRRPAEGHLTFPDPAVEAVLHLAGRHPYFTQQLCTTIWTLKDGAGNVAPEEVEEAAEDALTRSGGAADWLLSELTEGEQQVLIAIAEVTESKSAASLDDIRAALLARGRTFAGAGMTSAPERLAGWDVLKKDGEAFRFQVELLRRWTAQESRQRPVDFSARQAQEAYRAGYEYLLAKRPREAVEAFTRALQFVPAHVAALMGRAEASSKLNDLAKAVQDYERAFALDPARARDGLALTLLAVGRAFERDGNLQAAADAYRRAVEVAPDLPQLAPARERLVALEPQLRVLGRIPEMITIPAGEFVVGTSEAPIEWLVKNFGAKREWLGDETPQHRLALPEYRIARYPVTNAQYQAFVREARYRPPENWEGEAYPAGLGDHPVVYVSWPDAEAYCKWLNEVTGRKFRLPTEAEWEKAARGDRDARLWPWGNEWDTNKANTAERLAGRPLRTYAEWRQWYISAKISSPPTTPVGAYSPSGDSPYGCADMAGNVWEWVADWYKGYPKTKHKSDEFGEKYRVLRGGGWRDHPSHTRCAVRARRRAGYRSGRFGFRVSESV